MVICNRSHLELFAKGLFLGSRYPNLPLSRDFWAALAEGLWAVVVQRLDTFPVLSASNSLQESANVP